MSTQPRRIPMKYVISWFERPQGSPIEYENAQKRILEVFGQWKAPANFKVEFFVIRVGEWGGHMLVECDDPVTIHKFCSMLPAFVFEARPVITVEEAVRGELEVIAWTDAAGNPTKGTTVWSIGAADGEYFAPSKSTFMVNYRVEDLAAVLQSLRDEGCNVLEKTDDSEYGKFGWVMDPEGNKVELWQPPPGQ